MARIDHQWFIKSDADARESGPYSAQALVGEVNKGNTPSSAICRRADEADWRPVKAVFREVFAVAEERIQVKCEQCDNLMVFASRFAGRAAMCSKCKKVLVVPAQAAKPRENREAIKANEAKAPSQPEAPPNTAVPTQVAPRYGDGGSPSWENLPASTADALADTAPVHRIEITKAITIGRSEQLADLVLDNPQVSRVHARITPSDAGTIIHDQRSANGTFVNGRRLSAKTKLEPGDLINIGPFVLRFDGYQITTQTEANTIVLAAESVRRVVSSRRQEGKVLLDDVSLVIRPHEFVCVLGPSGSGKSTLLNALSARAPASSGRVLINSQDLYTHFEALKSNIALVHQNNALHESLTVEQALEFTAKLRLPSDTSAVESAQVVDRMLETVGLSEHRSKLIAMLSGGQLKRASLANELLSNPALLFLDEVTSGLDEQTDMEMMELFREIAERGRTVVAVTHSLANVESTCHLVVILANGGKLAFFGTPAEAVEHFQIKRLGEVYRKLEERTPHEWEAAYSATDLHTKYVQNRLPQSTVTPPALERSLTPREWFSAASRQCGTLLARYTAIQWSDRRALVTVLLQALLVGGLMALLFDPIASRVSSEADRLKRATDCTQIFFLLGISCLWFGCSNAAKEIVKERTIYDRERDANVRIESYVLSKFILLALIGALQVGILYAIVRYNTELPGSILGQLGMMILLSVVGVSIGLLISACAASEDQAQSAVPLVLIPQMILANVVAKVSGLTSFLAHGFVTLYWGFSGLASTVDSSIGVNQVNDAKYQNLDWIWALVILAAHLMLLLGATLWVMYYRAERNPSWGQEVRRVSRLAAIGIQVAQRGLQEVRRLRSTASDDSAASAD